MSYDYDDNGNLTSDTSGRTLIYSTFDKAVSITKGSHTSTFSYGPDRQRFLQIDSNSAVSSKNMTTVYLGNVELRKHNDGSYEWRRSVAGGLQTYTTDSNGQLTGDEERRYIFKDHLGSVDVIADAWGNIEQSMSFDPWGARRKETSSLPVLSATELFNFNDDITSRGYTGHEMLDEVGLIYMNGRLYDARLARFIQADPFVQAAKDVQMFNRYSYLRNNPLNATDPSGYFLKKLWNRVRPFVGTLVSIGFAVWQPWAASFGNSVLIGMISGAAGAAANGGNILRGAVMGGLSAAAFLKVGDMFSRTNCNGCYAPDGSEGFFGTELTRSAFAKKVLSHAVTGGVMSTLQGGKFGHGFAAAGVTQAFSGKIDTLDPHTGGASATRAFAAAVVGGTSSKLSGGKFANGAMTGAFSRLFNDEADHRKKNRPYSEDFWDEYLNYSDYDTAEVWDTVGGSLGDGYGPHSNSCAARVSHGVNHSGATIPRGAPGANLNFGGDNNGLRYILSARQLEVYLGGAWGAADYTNITHDQFSALSSSLSVGQVAVVVSQDHATVIRSGYSGDKYSVLGVGGSAWVLPTRPASN